MIRPYRINVPDSQMDDLKHRLDATRWASALADSGWTLGMDDGFLRSLCAYWRHEFSWPSVEARLNRYRQFNADIGEQTIHFVHIRSNDVNAVPIVLTHGWPSTFAELLALGEMLANPAPSDRAPSFNVVIPSLPGFPLSAAPSRLGLSVFEIADLWAQLMERLGYPKFYAHGGDIGAAVSTALALRHPDLLFGLHMNYVPGSYRPHVANPADLVDEERAFFERRAAWTEAEGAYAHVQSTKPDTLGPALNDSPVGLAAWIAEKYRSWSDCSGDVERRFSKTELLTTISLYWFTQSMPSAIRLYWETRQRPMQFVDGQSVTVPVGIAHFPRELPIPPRAYVERGYRVTHWSEMARGGHFAAAEEPALLAQDIRAFCQQVGYSA